MSLIHKFIERTATAAALCLLAAACFIMGVILAVMLYALPMGARLLGM